MHFDWRAIERARREGTPIPVSTILLPMVVIVVLVVAVATLFAVSLSIVVPDMIERISRAWQQGQR